MYISKNWLKDYVDLPDSLSADDLALQLTMSTVEVEKVVDQKKNLENIVVGKVVKLKKHPDADKLTVCRVTDGQQEYQVVCGGSNLSEGMLVALAKVGTGVKWHGEGEVVTLKKTRIRGVKSEAMIVSASEIGLGELIQSADEKEVIDLSTFDAKPGTPLAQLLQMEDMVLDIDNKSMTHRQDLWGHYGMAREVAAIHRKKLKKYSAPDIKPGKEINLKVDVENTVLCPRYMAVVVAGVNIEPSPDWLQKRLLSVGVRPINNIVDITNYIMFDLGQPMHVFDIDRLSHDNAELRVIVREATEGENFTALDESEHRLNSHDLVIADPEKPVALAGIIGGDNSQVTNKTKTIVLESANFNAVNVRRTALRLGLRSESSTRFEKSLDPNFAESALKKAVKLIQELCPEAKAVSSVADVSNYELQIGPIELPFEFVDMKIGMEIEKKKITDILQRLGFEIKEKKGELKVLIPSWRATKDISTPIDLVEEISRIYGYDNIDTSLPLFPVASPEKNKLRDLERELKNILSLEHGYSETYNYSFVSPLWLEKLGMNMEDNLRLLNPIAKDRPFLRTSLTPNLLEVVETNSHRKDEIRLFEVGKIFDRNAPGERMQKNSDDLLPRQDMMLGMVYAAKDDKTPFYQVSGSVMATLDRLGFNTRLRVKSAGFELYHHPGRCAEVVDKDGEEFGHVFELHPRIQSRIGMDFRVSVAELNISRLREFCLDRSRYTPLPIYPYSDRDIAFVVDRDVSHADLVATIKQSSPLIVEVELFDEFSTEEIGTKKKSMAYHLVYQSNDRTLKAQEVDQLHSKVEKVLKKEFDARVRK